MGDGILDDERSNPFRMRERKSETDRTVIVLHKENVAPHIESAHERIHDLRQTVEGVGEGLRVRGAAMAEAWIVWRDQVVAVGEQRH
jgi:hypothetical protein